MTQSVASLYFHRHTCKRKVTSIQGCTPTRYSAKLRTSSSRKEMLALVTCLLVAAASASDTCQMPGNAICHSVDLPDHQFHPCCSGSQCLPWTGEGYVPNADGPDYFCQYVEDIPVGGDCTVSYLFCIQGLSFILQKRRGSCDASSTCTDGVCV